MLADFATLSGMPRKRLPESEKKVPIAGRVPPSIFNAIADMAAADDRKLAYMVEKALREFVERHAPKAAGKPRPPK
jgi:hypothetical protein